MRPSISIFLISANKFVEKNKMIIANLKITEILVNKKLLRNISS